jgi:hypothetical protein
MKKVLLFAIVALSVNAFAQNNQPPSNSIINLRDMMGLAGKTKSDGRATMNLRQPFKLQTPNQGSLIQIFDSVYDWEWDTISNGWMINFKTINYVYDPNNNLISEIDQEKVGTAWVNSRKSTSTYDTKHNRTSILYQIWNDSAWVNSAQHIYTYDVNNNRTSELVQTWKNSTWGNVHEYTYMYDSKNNMISDLFQNWNGSAWVNFYQYEYTYDSNNNQTNELDQQWNGSAWVNSEEYTYTYNVDNKQLSGLVQEWTDSAWVNSTQTNYTYDSSGNLTTIIYKGWNGSSWIISFQSIFTYDDHNNLTSELDQQWYGGTWVTSGQSFYSYDVDNFQKGSSFRIWNITGTEITNGDSSYFYFHTVLGINELTPQDAGIAVYPNPTNGKFTISSQGDINAVEVYNLLGARISSCANFNGRTSAEIDLSNKSKGMYILNVHCGTKVYNCKIVVQ